MGDGTGVAVGGTAVGTGVAVAAGVAVAGSGVAVGKTTEVGVQFGVDVKVGLGVLVGGTGAAWGPKWGTHPAPSAKTKANMTNKTILRCIRYSPH